MSLNALGQSNYQGLISVHDCCFICFFKFLFIEMCPILLPHASIGHCNGFTSLVPNNSRQAKTDDTAASENVVHLKPTLKRMIPNRMMSSVNCCKVKGWDRKRKNVLTGLLETRKN